MTISDTHLLPFNCQKCGQPVRYEQTFRDVHVYRCTHDGLMCLRPDCTFGPPEAGEPAPKM